MSSRDQVASQIRFQLDQLSARNGHHDFEHLCRHLARLRICSNILPATGPVSAGGDQGRDFETFRTYLSESPIAGSSFVGLASQVPVVFACTLTQKDHLKTKIKGDVVVIKGGGTPVADIHYFCSSDLPVAQRHELQAWASEEQSAHLEIYDGQAISEILVDPDVFWIATRYLSIAAEIYPTAPAGESWYIELRNKWRGSGREPENFSDFGELKSAVRHATFTESAKPDLPLWIEKLTTLQKTTTWSPLQRRSVYEIAVASLRGLGTLESYEDQLRAYFSDVPDLYETADLEDAAVLWTYCAGAYKRGLVHLGTQELISLRDTIVAKVDEELTKTALPGRRSSLLEIRGYLALVMSAGASKSRPDYASAMRYWTELTDIVSQAPLFPLDRFADRLTKRLEMGAPPELDNLTARVDELLGERRGQAAAAEKCRDRSLALYKRGELIRAIKQIHQAKINWFSEETLRSSILAMLFLSRCYLDLGLAFASKYYALMAAYTSVRSPREDLKKIVPHALSDAASCDYLLGAWFGFFELESMTLATFSAFSREDDPEDPNSEINKALFHAVVIHRLTRLLNLELLPLVEETVGRWGLSEDLKDFFESVEDPWKNKELPEVWTSLEEQMIGRPFSDLGFQREVSFDALGVTWRFRWDNTYEMTAASEQLLATLQIILADLAGLDLCLLRTTVSVEIQPGYGNEILTTEVPSNDATKLRVLLPSKPRLEATSRDLIGWAMAAAGTLLHSASLLPSHNLLKIMEDAFRGGLGNKVFSVERYEALYYEFTSKKSFDGYNRRSLSVPESERRFNSGLHQLKWYCAPGPGYSAAAAEEAIRNRYKNSIRPIKRNLEQLSQSQHFKETVRTLRTENWLDWHILLALMNLILNYRLSKVRESGISLKEIKALFNKWTHEEEPRDSILIPPKEISVQRLRLHLQSSMLATLKTHGLEIPSRTPDFMAISDFLGERYRYWLDDVEHPDFGF